MQKKQPPEPVSQMKESIQETQNSRAQQLQTYQELKNYRNKTKHLFEAWVTQIYLQKKNSDDFQIADVIETNITRHLMDNTIRRILTDVCDTHKELIGEQMRFMLEASSAEYYYKVDSESCYVGFFDTCVSHQWVSQYDPPITGLSEPATLKSKTGLKINRQYYEYCVWVIYHHYCSLSQSNKQVCKLVERLRQNSQISKEVCDMYRNMQANRMIAQLQQVMDFEHQRNPDLKILLENDKQQKDTAKKVARLKLKAAEALNSTHQKSFNNTQYLYSPSYEDITFSSLVSYKIGDLVDDYDMIRQSQLNILMISNLIPLAMPNIDDQDDDEEIDQWIFNGFNEQDNYHHIYRHIKNFQKTINRIINHSKQNMRKHCSYLEQFKRAIIILRGRLRNVKKDSDRHKSKNVKEKHKSQSHRKFLEQKRLLQQQYKNDVSKELDRELRAANQENEEIDRDEEQERKLVREIEKSQFEIHKLKKQKKNEKKLGQKQEITLQRLRNIIDRDPLLKQKVLLNKKTSQKKSEAVSDKKQIPCQFGNPEYLLRRQKMLEEKQQANKNSCFPTLKSDKNPDISPNHSFFDSLFSMHVNDEHIIGERNTSAKFIKKTNIGGSKNVITTTTLTAKTTTTTINLPKSSNNKETNIYENLERKIKMLIDKDYGAEQQFQAVMSHLSNPSHSKINSNSSSTNFSEQPLVFTKSNLQKSKFPNPSLAEQLRIQKIRHLHHTISGGNEKNYSLSPFDAEQLGLHEFIQISNLKNDREDDDGNLDDLDDEQFLQRQEQEQKLKKKNKRKRNKKKKKQQQQQIKQLLKQEGIEGIERVLSAQKKIGTASMRQTEDTHIKQDNEFDEKQLQMPALTKIMSKKQSIVQNDATPESKVIKWLKQLNINQSQRDTCYPIPSQLMRKWQKMVKNRDNCGRQKLISLSLTPKKVSRGKKSVIKC